MNIQIAAQLAALTAKHWGYGIFREYRIFAEWNIPPLEAVCRI